MLSTIKILNLQQMARVLGQTKKEVEHAIVSGLLPAKRLAPGKCIIAEPVFYKWLGIEWSGYCDSSTDARGSDKCREIKNRIGTSIKGQAVRSGKSTSKTQEVENRFANLLGLPKKQKRVNSLEN